MSFSLRLWQVCLRVEIKKGRTRLWMERDFKVNPTLSPASSVKPSLTKLSCESASHSVMSDSLWPHGLYSPWNSSGQNTGVGILFLLPGTFPTQGSNPGLPHFRPILYQPSHMGSPRILEWIAYPFSSGSSQPRNWTRVSWSTSGFFTNWAIREAKLSNTHLLFQISSIACFYCTTQHSSCLTN